MKNLFIILSILLVENVANAQQRWNSAFIGKPETRALYASNVAKAIQNAWENELASKEKKELLLDEIIFGDEFDKKATQENDMTKTMTNNIDEIEEVLGIQERVVNPVKKINQSQIDDTTPLRKLDKIRILDIEEPVYKRLNNPTKTPIKRK